MKRRCDAPARDDVQSLPTLSAESVMSNSEHAVTTLVVPVPVPVPVPSPLYVSDLGKPQNQNDDRAASTTPSRKMILVVMLPFLMPAVGLVSSALDPSNAPMLSVDVTNARRVLLHVPEDDAIMEANMAAAHEAALAAGEEMYDEVMEACALQPREQKAGVHPVHSSV